MVYGMAYGHGMVYSITWRAFHDLWYGLEDMAWYIVGPGGQSRIYGTTYRAWYMV